MSNYKRLLLPTDATDANEPAVERARVLAQQNDAELNILHVVDYVPPQWVANELPAEFASESALVERAGKHLAAWAKQAGLEDCPREVSVGSPKRVIVDTARDTGVDLIVMGTHGERGLARIVGSTARGVLHDAPCDVLVVHS